MKSYLSTEDILNRVLNYMRKLNIGGFEVYVGCYEIQSYDQNMKEFVVIADWNDITRKLTAYIESECDAEIDFDDEYSTCECGKVVLIQPQFYGWTPNYMVGDGYLLCRECAESEPDTVIEEHVNSTCAIRNWMLPIIEEAGFVCFESEDSCNRYETGFHPGQNDGPQKVEAWLLDNLPDHDYIFAVDSVGQFDVQWSVHVRKRDERGEVEGCRAKV